MIGTHEHHPFPGLSVTVLVVTASLSTASAASFNQQDDFETGTTMNWGGNQFGTVSHVANGGPEGVGDGFLQTSVSDFHLGTKNTSQWAGNYLTAGIEAIEMDLNHIDPGFDRLNIRILLFGPTGTFASRTVTPDVPTNQWTHYVFGLTSNDLQQVPVGTASLSDTLSGVTTLLIRHDTPTPTTPGAHPPHITATLGIDNIRAVPRKPVFQGATRNGNDIEIHLTQLVDGVTYTVQTADTLAPNAWTNSADITASTDTTNVVISTDGDRGFIRTSIP